MATLAGSISRRVLVIGAALAVSLAGLMVNSSPVHAHTWSSAISNGCGTGYLNVKTMTVKTSGGSTYGYVKLLFNPSNGYNCVVVRKTAWHGTPTRVAAYLTPQGKSTVSDTGNFSHWAAAKTNARGRCVTFSGFIYNKPDFDGTQAKAVRSSSINCVRSKVAMTAQRELGNSNRNAEDPMGSNCNYYSDYWGYVCQQWCADFNKYVWKLAGVRYYGETHPGARSFYWYGKNHGTWHAGSSGIKVGDTAYYDYDGNLGYGSGHVGIVVSVSGSTIKVLSGNFSDRVKIHNLYDNSGFRGYIRPIGHS